MGLKMSILIGGVVVRGCKLVNLYGLKVGIFGVLVSCCYLARAGIYFLQDGVCYVICIASSGAARTKKRI